MKYFYFFLLRKQLKHSEEIVKIRSQAAEGRWCLDKFHKSSIGMFHAICNISKFNISNQLKRMVLIV